MNIWGMQCVRRPWNMDTVHRTLGTHISSGESRVKTPMIEGTTKIRQQPSKKKQTGRQHHWPNHRQPPLHMTALQLPNPNNSDPLGSSLMASGISQHLPQRPFPSLQNTFDVVLHLVLEQLYTVPINQRPVSLSGLLSPRRYQNGRESTALVTYDAAASCSSC